MNSLSVLPSLFAFALVIALIPAALWVLKRAQALRPARDGALQLVAGLALGPRERVAIVNVGDRSLVIGITAQSITHLATLDAQIAVDDPGADGQGKPLAPFAQLLASRLRKARSNAQEPNE